MTQHQEAGTRHSPDRRAHGGGVARVGRDAEPRRIDLVYRCAHAAREQADDEAEEGEDVGDEVVGDDDRPSCSSGGIRERGK